VSLSLHHKVTLGDPLAHLLEVETTIQSERPLPSALTLFMPVWTPGSYLVREYARHVEGLTCDVAGVPSKAVKVRKNAWRIEAAGASRVAVRYRLYCNELTVRTNHVDDTHAFLNPAATFLAVEGAEGTHATIDVLFPKGWKVATSLRLSSEDGASARLEAPDLDTLVDSPIEVGTLRQETFQVLGRPHRLVVWPADRIEDGDLTRLVEDSRAIVIEEARLFGNSLPYDDYLMLLHLSPRGRGGLEHKSCAALLATPQSLLTREGYLDLLSLIAHELLHAWNVKRIRPEGLTPYRYQEENYTRLLWWFEGATSYYDWRTLRRAKLCTIDEYLDHLASEIAQLDLTHGRLVHSLEDASFDAWIKLYRPDENTSNSSVSYYRKGEIVCAMLDLELRGRSAGRASLDTVLAHLWEHYGARSVPIPEGAMQEIVERAADTKVGDLFDTWIRAPGEIDYAPALSRAGLYLDRTTKGAADGATPKPPRVMLGVRARIEGGRWMVGQVTRGGAAQRAGIDPGDELLAVGGRRIEGGVEAALANLLPGVETDILVARDGRILTRRARLDEARPDRVRILAAVDASAAQRELCASWLGDPHTAWASK
jgi:predicted metalloprotease with PDZ domain